MSNVIQMPSLEIETQLAEISSLADAMLFMHESCGDDDRPRVMNTDTTLLYIIRDKVQTAMRSLEIVNRRAERLAS